MAEDSFSLQGQPGSQELPTEAAELMIMFVPVEGTVLPSQEAAA
jgi:hypothetical protein